RAIRTRLTRTLQPTSRSNQSSQTHSTTPARPRAHPATAAQTLPPRSHMAAPARRRMRKGDRQPSRARCRGSGAGGCIGRLRGERRRAAGCLSRRARLAIIAGRRGAGAAPLTPEELRMEGGPAWPTRGSTQELLRLAWPLILSNSCWTLQIVLDRVLLSWGADSDAVAAA